jgi:transcriptional regulator with XRE-family HTH domain
MSFGNRIRYIRGDLRQDEFGRMLDVQRNTVIAWESNTQLPQGKTILRIYEKFNVNLNWLFSGEGETHRPKNK